MPTYLPLQPYVVIDQNKCRDKATVGGLFVRCQQQGLSILLPDVALFEFSKGTLAYLTWRKSLEELCSEPDLVVAGRSLGQMMAQELETGQPVTDMVDSEVTPRFRAMLTELKKGDDTKINAALTELIRVTSSGSRFIDEEKSKREDHSTNKNIVVRLRDHWKNTLAPADVKQLRKEDKETFVRILSDQETAGIVFQAAKCDGCTDEVAHALTLGPSVYSHQIYALAALALDWLGQGGIEGADPEIITNDFHDLAYICIATFCTDLVTQDDRALRVYSGLVEALERRC